jgi:hypothetical protein
VLGDFNIAPDGRDVYDPGAWRGRNLCSEPERRRIRGLLDWGLTDPGGAGNPGPGPYALWDYRQGAFQRGWGLRIDLALATGPVAACCTAVTVGRDERMPTSGEGEPGDHARLIITLAPEPDATRRAMVSRSTCRVTRATAATGPCGSSGTGLASPAAFPCGTRRATSAATASSPAGCRCSRSGCQRLLARPWPGRCPDPVRDLVTADLQRLDAADQAVWEVN